jgi:hypothetical protein
LGVPERGVNGWAAFIEDDVWLLRFSSLARVPSSTLFSFLENFTSIMAAQESNATLSQEELATLSYV